MMPGAPRDSSRSQKSTNFWDRVVKNGCLPPPWGRRTRRRSARYSAGFLKTDQATAPPAGLVDVAMLWFPTATQRVDARAQQDASQWLSQPSGRPL